MSLIFVYGTLKQGCSNHAYLEGQAFVGTAASAPGYTLFNLDGYPGMVAHAGDADGVRGEVWSVDATCLARLDALECTTEGLYARELVPLRPPFDVESVEAYLYLPSVADRPKVGAEWTG